MSFFCQEETCFSYTSARASYAAASVACLQLGGELGRPWSGQQQVGSSCVDGPHFTCTCDCTWYTVGTGVAGVLSNMLIMLPIHGTRCTTEGNCAQSVCASIKGTSCSSSDLY